MAYVMSHNELYQHLESTVVHTEAAAAGGGDGGGGGIGGGGGGRGGRGRGLDNGAGGEVSPSREAPEDLVEVLCGDRVLEPHLYIGESYSTLLCDTCIVVGNGKRGERERERMNVLLVLATRFR